MPITKSAQKALRQNLRRRTKNVRQKEKTKDIIKQVKLLISQKKGEEAKKLLPQVYKVLDKAAKTGVIKPNAAARRKSRLMAWIKKQKTSAIGPGELIIESSLQSMIQYLVETWIVQRFYEILEDSKLAEFSARTVHLEESFQLLQERGKGIRFQYLRSWHELIDKGMRDIFSAQSIRRKARKVLNMNVSGQ